MHAWYTPNVSERATVGDEQALHATLEHELGYRFKDVALLMRALTHRSFTNESSSSGHNERLEFLGDAVLDDHVSRMLFERYPEASEGLLTRYRAALVREEMLASLAAAMELGPLLRMGRGEMQTGGQEKPRLLASALEALLGAVRLDGGYEATEALVRRLFDEPMKHLDDDASDYKSRLQERVQRLGAPPPVYRLLRSEGPEHDKRFVIEVVVATHGVACGEGRSKAAASQRAAQAAMELSDVRLVASDRGEQD